MASYRLYCLDGLGRIDLAEWIEAGDDDEALSQVRLRKSGAIECEVWEGGRLVGRLRANDLGPADRQRRAESAG